MSKAKALLNESTQILAESKFDSINQKVKEIGKKVSFTLGNQTVEAYKVNKDFIVVFMHGIGVMLLGSNGSEITMPFSDFDKLSKIF